MTSTSTSRRYDLDWLRIVAFAVLILYHVGMFYTTWDWHVTSDHASTALEPVMSLVNPWRLALLFFISGVALRFLLDSRGSRTVANDRINRLLLPLGFGVFVVVVPQGYVELRASGEIDSGLAGFYLSYISPMQTFSIITPTWNHLWFLPYVLVYSLVLAAVYRPLLRLHARVAAPASRWLERAPWSILLVLAIPLVLVAVTLDPVFPVTHTLIDDWATHAHSLAMVVMGWFAAKSTAFWQAIQASRVPALVLAIGLGVVVALTSDTDGGVAAAVSAVSSEFYAWAVIAALLGVAQEVLNRPSRALTYVTEAVLPWYILHQSITVVIGYAFIGSGVSLWVEAPVVLAGTVLGCVALHELLIRRVRWLRPLFGLKPRAPGHEVAAPG